VVLVAKLAIAEMEMPPANRTGSYLVS
jgi:hypothetical protein